MNWQVLHAALFQHGFTCMNSHLIFIVSFVVPVTCTGKLCSFKLPVSSIVFSEFTFFEAAVHSWPFSCLELARPNDHQRTKHMAETRISVLTFWEPSRIKKMYQSLLFSAVGANFIRSAASTTDACRWSRLPRETIKLIWKGVDSMTKNTRFQLISGNSLFFFSNGVITPFSAHFCLCFLS